MNPDTVWAVVVLYGCKVQLFHHKPTAEELHFVVGGWIEAIPLYDPQAGAAIGYINEEGKILQMPENDEATKLYGNPHDWIAGPMVILGPPDSEGEDTPIPPGWLEKLSISA